MSEFKEQLKEIQLNLTSEEIIDIVTNTLEAHTYTEMEDVIIFPTICHNIDSDSAKMKLYYYKNTCLFRCYTECDDAFDIFELFKKYYELRGIEYNFYRDVLLKIVSKNELQINQTGDTTYHPQRDRFFKKNRNVNLPIFPQRILEIFSKNYPIEWSYENISDNAMEYFHIRHSILDNKIIIPHYDIDGNLIGIRARALNEEDIVQFGKYAPIKIEGKWYTHPLSMNLYGINLNKKAIESTRTVILFEGEKSVILYGEYFGLDNNNSLAVCGNHFNKLQLNLLLKHFNISEIIFAFDKEYHDYPSKEATKYFERMEKMCKKYKHYCNFSFIFDSKNLLGYKDSPIDRGKGTFQKLLKGRVKITS